MSTLTNFHHLFIDNHAPKTLFLLHGTGGDENDLIPLVSNLKEKCNFVGLRGNVSEQGMTRFFKRDEKGVFDQESIKIETKKLAEFLSEWYEKHQARVDDCAFVGYSNGATMILAMAFYFPELISKGVVLHGKLPFEPTKTDLSSRSFLMTYGEEDWMISAEETLKAIEKIKECGAEVKVFAHPGGHEVRREEVYEMVQFLS
jgi:phospholipase/carboxylesterase